eukprot:m51a1_g4308 hypothetical protein (869) ;mRNA; f:34648-38484
MAAAWASVTSEALCLLYLAVSLALFVAEVVRRLQRPATPPGDDALCSSPLVGTTTPSPIVSDSECAVAEYSPRKNMCWCCSRRMAFKALLLVGCWTRAACFGLLAWSPAGLDASRGLQYLLYQAPTFVLFACFLIIVELWAEIVHADGNASGLRWLSLRVLAVAPVLLACCALVATELSAIIGALYLVLAVLYVAYGSVVVRMLRARRRAALESRALLHRCSHERPLARTVELRVGLTALLVAGSFLARGAICAWLLAAGSARLPPWWDLAYYPLAEVAPLAVLLALLYQPPGMRRSHHRRVPTPLRAAMPLVYARYSVVLVELAIVLLAFVTLLGVYLYGADLHIKANRIAGHQAEQAAAPLPKTFVLPVTSRTPAKNQASRGTCWIFATVGHIESSYRRNGFAKGFLAADEYVAFSEQAYGIGFVNYCKDKVGVDPWCVAGPAKGTPTDGRPEWLYYVGPKVRQYILPTAVCPYSPTEDRELECAGLGAATRANPVSLRIRGVESAHTVDSIKRLLLEKQTALPWDHAIYDATYTIPCSDRRTGLHNSSQCAQCAHPCRESSDGCCARLVLPGYTNEGVFSLHGWPVAAGGHAMLVVGWNDELRVDTGLPGEMREHTTGGFILKNSWGSRGHSVGYWAREHSLTDEAFICPAEASARTWLPANATCMLRQAADPVACSGGAVKVVRKQWVHGATVLKCGKITDPVTARVLGWDGCRQGMRYVLAADPDNKGEVYVTVPRNSDGYVQFDLVEWDPADPAGTARLIRTGGTTWYGLENLLTPVKIVGNSEEQCGYYFMPYETLTEGNIRYPVTGTDVATVLYVDIEWDDSSYLVNKNNAALNYSLIHKSTKKMKETKFQGPFDWNAEV